MRILWLAPEPPTPPLTGGRERSRKMLAYLSERHRVHLLTLAEEADGPALQDLAARLDGLTVVSYQARTEDNPAALQAGLDELLTRWRPDCLHVQGLEAWPGQPCSEACVLDLHDVPTVLAGRLEALRPGRLSSSRRWPFGWLGRRRDRRLERLEQQALRAARTVVVTCREDGLLLSRHGLPLPDIVVVSNGVDTDYWRLPATRPERPTILFPGALNWTPNVDAAQRLVSAILPIVQASVPGAQVILAGRRPDPLLVRLAAARPEVTLLADPADMRPSFARATVIAVPLRAATGTRLKILQALAGGRAVVSTPVGAAGLDLEPGRHLLVEPLVESFAAAVVRLLQDRQARDRLAEAGQQAVERFDWRRCLPALEAVYPPTGTS